MIFNSSPTISKALTLFFNKLVLSTRFMRLTTTIEMPYGEAIILKNNVIAGFS